jgi:hypothetical protein
MCDKNFGSGLAQPYRELYPVVGSSVTSMELPSRAVVRFYDKRGPEQRRIKEGKLAANWPALLSPFYTHLFIRQSLFRVFHLTFYSRSLVG